jgi:quercetin dioxygenase-like cupin family protein
VSPLSSVQTVRWSDTDGAKVSEVALRSLLADEGLTATRWSNGPGDTYAVHSHDYHKVIYVVEGSITFGLPTSHEEVMLSPGDRLELLRGTTHNARVGPAGVLCLEAHRQT